jgi:hypothetical protein
MPLFQKNKIKVVLQGINRNPFARFADEPGHGNKVLMLNNGQHQNKLRDELQNDKEQNLEKATTMKVQKEKEVRLQGTKPGESYHHEGAEGEGSKEQNLEKATTMKVRKEKEVREQNLEKATTMKVQKGKEVRANTTRNRM